MVILNRNFVKYNIYVNFKNIYNLISMLKILRHIMLLQSYVAKLLKLLRN